MSERLKSAEHPAASAVFDRRFMRKGKHSAILFLPDEYFAPIGRIIAHWGNFEVAFDKCLSALIAGEARDGIRRDTDAWRSQQFKRRRKLFKAICKEWLSPWRPEEAETLAKIVDKAADLSKRRNMIAHGSYAYTVPAKSSVATNCRAINHETGAVMPFDGEVLAKMHHDISHLTADLVFTFKAFGKIEGSFHAVPDAEILRIYRETNHPWNPNPSKRTP